MSSIYAEEYQRLISLLRTARREKGLTQQQLASALKRPQSFIAKVENGERRLDVIEFAHLAHLLSLNPADVLGAVMNPMPKP
ncbi:XRE family transcriptional regulator [Chimaeribacter arupi]|uniref:XRE family transcriptional regulator n=2 Tax=Yersiniaceae TaxID=1903411 RepID=A0A2N5ELE9_9GAMM|nr:MULTISPECIES: helix-turn-helix transcriptional regulator [Yersiniaceae]MBS0967889.1 helix-turn-helix transcriptional regulator [Nissabacter archeti]MDV5142545.1 helix-turn-helix transcriptional regulator [Chimaeribacter arupi]PLR37133.1 XRE family transcriptional regulator [Chimaeribacter arupi]PLR45570.1 XRE family transcriptional regulator [Chimaeribacter arupi]PLR48021.1 XRE family transcriptional regulator [Chimaeribacter arupi]